MVLAFKNVAAAVALLLILQTFQAGSLPMDKSKGDKDKGKGGLMDDVVGLDKSKGGKDKGKGDLVDGEVMSFADALAEDIQAHLFLEDEGREKRSVDTSALAEDTSASDALAEDAVARDDLQGLSGGKKPCKGRGGSGSGNGTTTDSEVETMQQRSSNGGKRRRGGGGNSTLTEEPAKLAASWLIGDVPEGFW